MCGIAGLIDFSNGSTQNVLKDMTDALEHRGPDDCGYLFKQYDSAQLGLGHRRLSILDLSKKGHQPMFFQDLSIIYNGEVYNFEEIRFDLEKFGYKFVSNSDTEVILKAYHKWGIEMVNRLNGMFAIAIFDSKNNNLTLIRDRAGVKPLFWHFDNDLFMFASELKSFHKHPSFNKKLNKQGLELFLEYGYIPQPYTIFEKTHKLEAGCFLRININNQDVATEKYWDVIDCYEKPKLKISDKEAEVETERILKSAFDYRMIADVPVGIFLSGGYDSSIVAAMIQSDRTDRVKTFTIGFQEDKFNESTHAAKVANFLKTDHTEYYCTQKDALNILPKLPDIWDEPFADPSVIPTLVVSQLARKEVTVSLSADGGDEAFGGYSKYIGIEKKLNTISKVPYSLQPLTKQILRNNLVHKLADKFGVKNSKFRLTRFSESLGFNEKEFLKHGSKNISDHELESILLNVNGNSTTNFDREINEHWLDNIMAIDYKTYQQDNILTKVDRATMSVSLEGREPLLDYRIIEFVSQLDPALKIRNGDKKYLLKKIAHNYLPKEIMNRPKMGFGVPIINWFKEELKEYLLYYLSKDRLKEGGIFHVNEVIRLRNDYLDGHNLEIDQLWNILIFEMWREKWMGE